MVVLERTTRPRDHGLPSVRTSVRLDGADVAVGKAGAHGSANRSDEKQAVLMAPRTATHHVRAGRRAPV